MIAAVPVRPVALRYADANHPVRPSAPYSDDDTMLGSLWRTARAESLLASVQILAVNGSAAVHRRTLGAALRLAIQVALDAGPPAQMADRVSAPGAAQSSRRAAMPPGDS